MSTPSLNVLHAIHDFLPRHQAGSELYAFELCRGLQERHHVTVKCADFDGSRPLRPGLVMLDLNMPGKDGREALADMKAGPALLGIPVVVLTTSRDEEDVVRSYDLGVSGFIHKPASYAALLEMVTVLGKYWTEVVALPPV